MQESNCQRLLWQGSYGELDLHYPLIKLAAIVDYANKQSFLETNSSKKETNFGRKSPCIVTLMNLICLLT